VPPFVLGLVLGDILDKSLRRGLQITNGDLTPFFVRPVCALLFAITLFTVLMYIPPVNRMVKNSWAKIWKWS
jgi:putative tricarboxylic transport membrane protein